MSKVITFDRGSKRQLSQIRWKLFELVSLTVLAIVVFAMGLFIMFWELQRVHHHAPSKTPQIKRTEPAEP